MPDENQPNPPAPKPASYKELKAAFPNATPEFITAQLDAEATLERATRAYHAALEERAAAAEVKAQELEAKTQELEAKAQKPRSGVDPLPEGRGSTISDPEAEWNEKLRELTDRGMSRQRAVSQLARRQPELRAAMIEEVNARAGRPVVLHD